MRCRTAFLVFQNSSFCNSFLQHHPTPLAGHRQEKTEKIRLEQEKTDDSAEPSPKTGMIRPFDTYMHPPARQREKDVHSAACCHVQRSKNHTPSRSARKIRLDRVNSPKYCFFLLYGLRCQDRDASHRYGVAGQLGFECSRREPQRIADNP